MGNGEVKTRQMEIIARHMDHTVKPRTTTRASGISENLFASKRKIRIATNGLNGESQEIVTRGLLKLGTAEEVIATIDALGAETHR